MYNALSRQATSNWPSVTMQVGGSVVRDALVTLLLTGSQRLMRWLDRSIGDDRSAVHMYSYRIVERIRNQILILVISYCRTRQRVLRARAPTYCITGEWSATRKAPPAGQRLVSRLQLTAAGRPAGWLAG